MNQIDTDDEQHFREEKKMKCGEKEKKQNKSDRLKRIKCVKKSYELS